MARPPCIELAGRRERTRIPVLYEDRSVIALDKPAGWMLVPFSWQRTSRNLQAAITSSIAARAFWAKARNLKFLRHVHRLDGDTTGILLWAKSLGAVDTYSHLFESRIMEKRYLAVVHGVPTAAEWTCSAPLAPDPRKIGRMRVEPRHGKEAETAFRCQQTNGRWTLIEARPRTGRTHQIRVHLLEAGHPIVGDELYGLATLAHRKQAGRKSRMFPLGLRAVGLRYVDPFTRRNVLVQAPEGEFRRAFDFAIETAAPVPVRT